jgi:hypothetical protein
MITATAAIRVQTMSKTLAITVWALRVLAAVILLQTLFFKFTGAAESKYIFGTVGRFIGNYWAAGAALVGEPGGRIGSGIAELIAASLILYQRTTWLGAIIASGVMAGAIVAHLTILGLEVQGDGGLLFGLALTVFSTSVALVVIFRSKLPIIGGRL